MRHNLIAELGPLNKITEGQVYEIVYKDLVSIGMLDTKLYPDVASWCKDVVNNNNGFITHNRSDEIIDTSIPISDKNSRQQIIFAIGIDLFKTSKWSKIKGLKESWREVKWEHYFNCAVTRNGELIYKYQSYSFPVYSGTLLKRSKEDTQHIPDCFDCSYNSSIFCDYRPWVIKKNTYDKPSPPKWADISQKIYFDIDEVKQIYDFETSELIRCIKVAKTLKDEYNEAIKDSRKFLAEANRLRKEANLKTREAKQLIINVKNKIKTTLIRKSDLEGDF